jgi:peptide/nickel transport system ATP-binding protein
MRFYSQSATSLFKAVVRRLAELGKASCVKANAPTSEASPAALLMVRDLAVEFPIRRGLFKRKVGAMRAVDGVTFCHRARPHPGGRRRVWLRQNHDGQRNPAPDATGRRQSVEFAGVDLASLDAAAMRSQRAHLQIVFQDPVASMNPRMIVGDIIKEGMLAQQVSAPDRRGTRSPRCRSCLSQVGLEASHARRYPHEFSGGSDSASVSPVHWPSSRA